MRVKLVGLILLISTFLILCLTGVFTDKYDKATKESIIYLDGFFAAMNDGELIVDSDDLDTIMTEINNRLGKYMTKDFQGQLRNDIKLALADEIDFEKEPHRFSFFLYNEGDGFRFAKGEVMDRSSWLSAGDDIVGTYVVYRMHEDIRDYDVSSASKGSSTAVLIMKEDEKWKIDIDR